MRELLGELMEFMKELRESNDEQALILSFGSHEPSIDTNKGSFTVTAKKYGITETSEAVHLHDALLLVRAKIEAIQQRKLEKLAKEKAEKKPLVSPAFKGFESE